jgi:hypothetical protein
MKMVSCEKETNACGSEPEVKESDRVMEMLTHHELKAFALDNKLNQLDQIYIIEVGEIKKRLFEIEKTYVHAGILNEIQARFKDIEYRLNHIVEWPTEVDIRLEDVERKIDGLGNNFIKLRKDFENRIIQLEKQIQVLTEMYKDLSIKHVKIIDYELTEKYELNKKPHRCPLCEGYGIHNNGHQCRSCEGKGLVWG